MKKLLTILLLSIPFMLCAQNTVFLVYQPTDRGLGIRYDYQKEIGFYASVTKGDYQFIESYVKNHRKIAVGGLYKAFSLGLSYHEYGEIKGEFNDRGLKPFSFEIGGKVKANRLCVGIRADFLKGEGSADIGFNF
jgi:hypothetical protein